MNSIISLTLLLSLIFLKYINNKEGYSFLITTIYLTTNYIMFLIAAGISYFPNKIFNIRNNYISFIGIIIIYITLIIILFKIKRFKRGFMIFKEKMNNEYFDMLILNISVVILFSIIIISNYKENITGNIIIGLIVSAIIMFITIQKSLQLYYKQKMLIQDLNETKKELEDKKQEIEQLEKENLDFSKTSHSIAHKQRVLEHKLNELMLKSEIAEEIDIKDRVNKLSKEIYKDTEIIELKKTNISEIDDMLKYMQSECIKNKINFELKIAGNIHHMTNTYISKENLEILLADHIKNAIIAINHSDNSNKSILVRLGIIDGVYSLYIYDSGIEFEINTLLNLGKIPSTTHAGEGGTGMGFMNTFDTLNKYKASLIINEYNKPNKDDYTKSIKIKFDKKNEFKICSYRYEKIKGKDKNNNLIVERIS